MSATPGSWFNENLDSSAFLKNYTPFAYTDAWKNFTTPSSSTSPTPLSQTNTSSTAPTWMDRYDPSKPAYWADQARSFGTGIASSFFPSTDYTKYAAAMGALSASDAINPLMANSASMYGMGAAADIQRAIFAKQGDDQVNYGSHVENQIATDKRLREAIDSAYETSKLTRGVRSADFMKPASIQAGVDLYSLASKQPFSVTSPIAFK